MDGTIVRATIDSCNPVFAEVPLGDNPAALVIENSKITENYRTHTCQPTQKMSLNQAVKSFI